jgi:hypothetical protein
MPEMTRELGWLALLKGNLAAAHARLSESLAISKEMDDKGEILTALTWLVVVNIVQCEYANYSNIETH